MIVQKLKYEAKDSFEMANRYYAVLSALNGFSLTARELQLLSFTATRGSMSYGNIKDEFCKRFDTSYPTISNIVYKLKKMRLLVKIEGKIIVNPVIALDFKNDVVMNITLTHGKEKDNL